MGGTSSSSRGSGYIKQLLVKTGKKAGKGTDANVYVVLYDKLGRKTKKKLLDNKFKDDLESGQTDKFDIDLR